MIIRGNRLIAEGGMRLISGETIATEAWLAPSDSVDNWREITEAEALAIEEAMKDELEEQN